MASQSQSSQCAFKLEELLAQSSRTPEVWREIESNAKSLANDLRVRDGETDMHTALGNSTLPQTLTELLKSALNNSKVPSFVSAPAAFEILRVGANLSMDHDGNRGNLLEAAFPQTVVSLLEGYAESIPRHVTEPLSITIPDLKVVKTAIGVILNSSVGYEPTLSRLNSMEAALIILRLSVAIYPPGSWLGAIPSSENANWKEEWTLRSGLSGWSWRAITELKDASPRALGPDALPLLISLLPVSTSPYPAPTEALTDHTQFHHMLVQTDVETLEEVSALFESLCLDVEDIRLSLARGMIFPEEHGGVHCLEQVLAFIEQGDYPPCWASESETDQRRYKRTFDLCKAAFIKAVVEVAGEEKNTDVMWDDSEVDSPGGPYVSKMVEWIRRGAIGDSSDFRDDLVICATVSLGNLVRREAHSLAIVKPPISLTNPLASLLEPNTDIKVKHGVIGLLKHLAQSSANRETIGQGGVIQKLVLSKVWSEQSDFAEIVQVSAIGVAKYVCTGNVENSCSLVLPVGEHSDVPSALDQILALTRRSDSIAVKSEGTRVLVNILKSLWSNIPGRDNGRRQTAMELVTTSASATALAQLVGRSKRYSILVNEGVVALSLLCTRPVGAPLVIDAICATLPPEVSTASSSGSESSPVAAPLCALDMLVLVLKNADNRFPPEVLANICALLIQIGKSASDGHVDRFVELSQLKLVTKEPLEAAAQTHDATFLTTAAQKALEALA